MKGVALAGNKVEWIARAGEEVGHPPNFKRSLGLDQSSSAVDRAQHREEHQTFKQLKLK